MDPVSEISSWLDQARAHPDIPESGAMALATTGRDGHPSVRMVLLRGFDARGAVFFTNHGSRKARDLEENPWAAGVLWWAPLGRQLRLFGPVSRIDDSESDAYFACRPRLSQEAAWASRQSSGGARTELEGRLAEIQARFAGATIPRPPFWGGYRIELREIELWIEAAGRLHHRRHFEWVGESWRRRDLDP